LHILIVKLSSLGDVIHCLPSLEALRHRFSEAKIDWLVEHQNADILQGHPHIDRLIILSRKSWMKSPWQIGRIYSEISDFVRDLRSIDYDIVIDFQGLFRSGFLVGLCRGKRKIGFDRVREMAHLFYNEKVPLSTLDQHAVTRYLEIPRYLGANLSNPEFFLPIPKEDEEYANKLLEQLLKNKKHINKIIYINPNARWPSKIWPLERFRALIKELSLRGNAVILIGGPNDRDRMEKAFHGIGENVYNLAGQTSLKGVAAILKRGDCLVTNDSGPMHLAVAVGLPVIAFFGPTNPLRTGPFEWDNGEKKNKVLSCGVDCAPCYQKECTHRKCLEDISVDDVLDALEQLPGLKLKTL